MKLSFGALLSIILQVFAISSASKSDNTIETTNENTKESQPSVVITMKSGNRKNCCFYSENDTPFNKSV
ncbi:putative SP-containing protein [Vairimorpha necatrix]|uniref:SP-containing protein n=1 Tax=Vairimorpha necatrix TaxID=6039 RepID=A0AAX4JGW4_9MICR